jgi:uncharacterized protein (TIGR02302 family)
LTETNLPAPAPEPPRAEAARTLLAATLKRARWTIFWERLWPALAGFLTAAGVFLALAWLGVFLWLPPLGRAAVTILCGALAAAALIPFLRLRLPALRDSLNRLDHDSGVRHRPATAITDDLAVTPKDPYSLALWNAHVERALVAARAPKTGWPSPQVAQHDRYAVRALVLVACVATFVAAGGERWRRVAMAFDWHGVVLPANFRVDAWVIPPVYTGKPPIVLQGIHPGETAALPVQSGIMAVPVNSTLVVRSTGKADLEVTNSGGVTAAKDDTKAPAGTEEHRFSIAATGSATLRGAGDDLTWAFNAIPDTPPKIELTKDPERQERGSLMLSYHLEDDYGVSEAHATFARKDDSAAAGETAHPLYGPPDFPLVLPQARTKNANGQTIKDLSDHPWAGVQVLLTLTAKDDGGNEGKSEPTAFQLPERLFTKPVARALVEQRRNLALDANARPLVLTAIDALTLAPDQFGTSAGVYLGLRGIFWSLVRAKNDDQLREVADRMWSMAVQLEDGDVSDAQAQLRNAEEALRQALERGASDSELKELMDKLRAAMDRFMQAMREQLKNTQQLSRPLGPNDHVLSQRDLQNMLDKLQQLAQSGNKDAARQLLQQLQQMMENLQMAQPGMDNGDDQDDMMSELDELGDMIHQQQDLRDRTFKQGQQQQQDQRQPRGGQSRPNGQPNPQQGNGDLRQNQQALHDRLNKLLNDLKNRGLGQNGQRGQDGQQGQGQTQGNDQLDQLGQAGKDMDDAQNALGDGNNDGAVDSQGQALDAMRKGAQSLAQSMQQQMGQGQSPGRPGRMGQSRAEQDTDPLGRPLRGRDYGDDSTVRVPGEIDVQRARRIIEELRKRFGDFSRSQEELDYIERLLKDY